MEAGSFAEGGLLPDHTPLDLVQFAIPWEAIFEALAFIVVLAFVIERVLALVFESPAYITFAKRRWDQDQSSHKEVIAYLASAIVCVLYQIDLLGILMSHAYPSIFGELLTAGVVAGGSKASVKLFRDILGFKSGAYEEYQRYKKEEGMQKKKSRDAGSEVSGEGVPKDKSEDKKQ